MYRNILLQARAQARGVAGEHLVHGLRGTERVRNALSG